MTTMNSSAVHGPPRELVRSPLPGGSVTFSGVPAGITMRRPAFDCCDYLRAVVARPGQSQKALLDVPGGVPVSIPPPAPRVLLANSSTGPEA